MKKFGMNLWGRIKKNLEIKREFRYFKHQYYEFSSITFVVNVWESIPYLKLWEGHFLNHVEYLYIIKFSELKIILYLIKF